MPGDPRTTARRAFTLIELLVVVTIIVVLLAVMLPAMSAARGSARTTMGLAHLREIGHAVFLYAPSWNDMLPPGFYYEPGSPKNTDWAIILEGMLTDTGQTTATFGFDTGRQLGKTYTGPNATLDGGRTHYSSNPILMPDLSPTRPIRRTYPATALTRSDRLVLIADGAQDPEAQFNSHATLFSVDDYGLWVNPATGPPRYYGSADADGADPIAPGPNVDTHAAAGTIRWRQWGDRAANILFADAHAATTTPDAIRKSDLRPSR
ncbi:MAG: prepilin-type N-terminal cleavage/methylation domain-containing protein [Phycisphaera sp.]|nr:prepilin-type N-terminal cleavage/methylation domain-containing protein [Phycisphaera sp.]